jgi:CelD/BcsL family acetyltransferase involved in cellulose biosynthesis
VWLYGIGAHGDFNGDGVRDYSWHGGDDTSDSMYVVLSSASGFRTVDVNATMEAAWTRRYGRKSPDFALQDDVWIKAVQLERTEEEISLVISVVDGRKLPKLPVLRFRVDQSQFVFK